MTAKQGSCRSDRPALDVDCRVRVSVTRALLADALIATVIALLLLREFMQ